MESPSTLDVKLAPVVDVFEFYCVVRKCASLTHPRDALLMRGLGIWLSKEESVFPVAEPNPPQSWHGGDESCHLGMLDLSDLPGVALREPGCRLRISGPSYSPGLC